MNTSVPRAARFVPWLSRKHVQVRNHRGPCCREPFSDCSMLRACSAAPSELTNVNLQARTHHVQFELVDSRYALCQVDGAEIFTKTAAETGSHSVFPRPSVERRNVCGGGRSAAQTTAASPTIIAAGTQSDSRTPFDMEQLAADALTLIRTLSLPPCHFVGLSMGGFCRHATRGPPSRAAALAHAD